MKNVLGEIEYRIKMLTQFIDKCEAGMYVTDYHTCEILYANRKMISCGGNQLNIEDVIGKACWTLMNYEGGGRCSFCPYEKLIDDSNTPLEPYEWEHFFPNLNKWLKIISEAITWVDGRLAHAVTFYDITELKMVQEQLADLAFIDQQLRLKNGVKLEQDMREAGDALSLIILDVVALQKVNDAYGRTTGDSLLVEVRDWILNQNIPNSELYRVGGDEFCLAIRNISMDSLRPLASTLHHRFSDPWIFQLNGHKLNIFCEATVATIHSSYKNEGESLLNLVERALKTAKDNRSVIIYDDKMDRRFKNQLALEWSLRKSVHEDMNGFIVYYQPIADSLTGEWLGLEALCRWNSPELGLISPLMFIPEAERLALIDRIGQWVLETSIHNCKTWGLDKCNKFTLNVNVSAAQFSDETLAEKILEILRKYDFPCERLCLEITESNRFTFTELSLNTIDLLRENNVLVALDDFGTGYSNFSNLKSLPINIVKIERDFTADIETNDYHQYLFRAMVGLAHAANTKLVAEGVESHRQMQLLVENGADFLQGYLFSRPIPPDKLEQQLHRFFYQ